MGDRLFHTLDPTTRQRRALRPRLPDHRHGRLHREAAPPAGRGLQGDPRGDGARRPDPPGGRRGSARGAATGRPGGGRRRAGGDRRRPAPAAAGAEQGRPARRRRAPRGAAAPPGAVLVSALEGEGIGELRERIEAAFEDTLAEVELLVPYSEGLGCTSCTRSRATSSGPSGPTGCSCRRRCRARSCTGSTTCGPRPRRGRAASPAWSGRVAAVQIPDREAEGRGDPAQQGA